MKKYIDIEAPEFTFFHHAGQYRSSEFDMHIHDTFEILCFISGNANYLVEGKKYKLRPGSIMLMRSAESHCLILNSDEVYERYVINFYPEMLTSLGLPKSLFLPFTDRSLGERNLYLSSEFDGISPQKLFAKMEKEAKGLDPRQAVIINLAALLSAIGIVFSEQPHVRITQKNYTSDSILDYINEYLFTDLSLETLSERFHISPSQINRIFRQSTGTSVYHYISIKRLIAAQELISTGENATVASQRCGFNDYSSFYRLYKKYFGASPTASNRRILQSEP